MLRIVMLLVMALAPVRAADLAGKWLLKSQQVAGQETTSRALWLRITQKGDQVQFEYLVAVKDKQEVSMRFTAKLDGADGEIQNFTGRKIGTVKVTRAGPSSFLVMLQGPNRPTSSGKLTLSNDGKTLVSESDATAPGGVKTHTVQVFERQ